MFRLALLITLTLFSCGFCNKVINLLKLADVEHLPGIITVPGACMDVDEKAYKIETTLFIADHLNQLEGLFSYNFTILVGFRLTNIETPNLLTFYKENGDIKFSVGFLANKGNLVINYNDQLGQEKPIEFDFKVEPNKWYHIGLIINGQQVSLVVDGKLADSKTLRRDRRKALSTSGFLLIGSEVSRDDFFEGYIEQLLIIQNNGTDVGQIKKRFMTCQYNFTDEKAKKSDKPTIIPTSCVDVRFSQKKPADGIYKIDPNQGMPNDSLFVSCNFSTKTAKTCMQLPQFAIFKSNTYSIAFNQTTLVQLKFLRLLHLNVKQSITIPTNRSQSIVFISWDGFRWPAEIKNDTKSKSKRSQPKCHWFQNENTTKSISIYKFDFHMRRHLNRLPVKKILLKDSDIFVANSSSVLCFS